MPKFVGDGSEVYFPICNKCKHKGMGLTCKAFPKRIPDIILDGISKHSKPIKGQVGDYVFEKVGDK